MTDALPAGLTYVSATGMGWTCNAVSNTVTCTYTANLAVGQELLCYRARVDGKGAFIPNAVATERDTGDRSKPIIFIEKTVWAIAVAKLCLERIE